MKRSRSYLSGAAKRRIKEKKVEIANKLKGSLSKYFVKSDDNEEGETGNISSVQPPESSVTNIDLSEIKENIGRKNVSSNEEEEIQTVVDKEKALSWEKEKNTMEVIHADQQEIDLQLDGKETDAENSRNLDDMAMEDYQKFFDDPAKWEEVTDQMREYFVKYPPPQNIQHIDKTERFICDQKRCLTVKHFYRYKCNQEKIKREWLVLSASAGTLFCWICKLFSSTAATTLSTTGFCDWKHVSARLQEHENSYFHREAVCNMIQRKDVSCRIDSNIAEKKYCESKYWYEVLRRVVAVTKFLSVRGLPFFGQNETIGSLHNGNFLGCLELLSEFDPFLAKHLETNGNPGSGRTSYLSSTTLNEFIGLMSKKVLSCIIAEVKTSKYFSIIVDSTPDLSCTDQLTFVLRYITVDCEPIERFVKFIPIDEHGSEHLEETVTNFICDMGLNISDCRGQSYDNASNMAGKYNGLQARIRELNPLAEFIPCSAHSLNLVVVKAVECNGRVLDFFTFLQEVYNFFHSSTRRWKTLNDKIKEKGHDTLTLKSRSGTRWCANAAATRALRQNYKEISEVLHKLSLRDEETPSTRNEAKALLKKLQKLETAIFCAVWDTILQRINAVSKILQSSLMDVSQIPKLFTSLIEFISFMRDDYSKYEEEGSSLVEHQDYSEKRVKKRPKSFYDGQCLETKLNSRESFKVSCFYTICDTLNVQLTHRLSNYQGIIKKFSCLFDSDKKVAHENAKLLQNAYQSDLDEDFPDEFTHIFSTLKKELSVTEKLKTLNKLGIMGTFANVETALKLFLTLPISNCTGERSFSLLKRLKSPLRTLITDSKLSSLAILSLEGDVTCKLDYEDVINDFVAKKFRRKIIKSH